jgi:hypothetical protein
MATMGKDWSFHVRLLGFIRYVLKASVAKFPPPLPTFRLLPLHVLYILPSGDTLKLLQKKLILTVPVSLANGQTSKEVNSFDRPQTTNTDTDTDNTGDPTTFAYCRWG